MVGSWTMTALAPLLRRTALCIQRGLPVRCLLRHTSTLRGKGLRSLSRCQIERSYLRLAYWFGREQRRRRKEERSTEELEKLRDLIGLVGPSDTSGFSPCATGGFQGR